MDVQQNGSMTVITDTVGCVLILKTREHGCETVAFRTAIAAGEADCQSIDGRISGPCLRQRERDFLVLAAGYFNGSGHLNGACSVATFGNLDLFVSAIFAARW